MGFILLVNGCSYPSTTAVEVWCSS